MQFPRFIFTLWMPLIALLCLAPVQLVAVSFNDDFPWSEKHHWRSPDAVTGGFFINLGLTGARARMRPNDLRSLEVAYIFADTPAVGKLQIGDRIVGANGKPFSAPTGKDGAPYENPYDPLIPNKIIDSGIGGPLTDLGNALEESQGALNGQLMLTVVRGEIQSEVVLNIGTRYGAFRGDFPLGSCPKTDLILSELYPYLLENKDWWNGNWMGLLALLASGDRKYYDVVREGVKRMADNTEGILRDSVKWELPCWEYTFAGIVLSEYYLATGESWVLPELEQIRDWLYSAQLMSVDQVDLLWSEFTLTDVRNCFGGIGHGPGFRGYGPIAITTGQLAVAYSLIQKCGIDVDRVRIDAALDHLAQCTGPTGVVAYDSKGGQYNGTDWYDQGRAGATALANFLCNYPEPKYQQRANLISSQVGTNNAFYADTHASAEIGMIWGAAGAHAQPAAFSKLMNDWKWFFNLAHNPDGSFHFQPTRENYSLGNTNPRVSMSMIMAFVFSLHKKNLRISGSTAPVPVIPTVSTTNVTGISLTEAQSGGEVTNAPVSGFASVTARGVCWATTINPTTDDQTTSDETGNGSFISSLSGLAAGTTYYVRSYATNTVGTAYGPMVSFTTTTTPVAGAPTVTTTAATGVTGTGAQSGGDVTAMGDTLVTARGVCWATTGNPTTANSLTSNGTGGGVFASTLTGLAAETTYYYRAFATNSAGTSYGAQMFFVTPAAAGGGAGSNPSAGDGNSCGLGAVSAIVLLMLMALWVRKP